MLFSVTMMMVIMTDVGIDRGISKGRCDQEKEGIEGDEFHGNMIRNRAMQSSLISKQVVYWPSVGAKEV